MHDCTDRTGLIREEEIIRRLRESFWKSPQNDLRVPSLKINEENKAAGQGNEIYGRGQRT